jgi:ComF family protein
VPEGTGGDIVHQFKYEGWPRLADDMARLMAARGSGLPSGTPGVLVPVPLGAARRRERGYNQAHALADALGRRWSMPVVGDALARARETRSQVPLTPDARSANVQGAFVATETADVLRGTHVVLVDDVITTAATLTASADALSLVGPLSISFVTFGRARAAWDRGATSRSSNP